MKEDQADLVLRGNDERCRWCGNRIIVGDAVRYSWVHDQDVHQECYEAHEEEQNNEQIKG